MTSLRELVERDPLGSADAELRQQDGMEFFGSYLSPSVDPLWPRALSKFTCDIPLRYWDRDVLEKALEVLEEDTRRTFEALDTWKNRIGIGFDYLLRRAAIENYEENLSTSKAPELLKLANEFHPEYLRRCEHIFTNLITLYWAVLKRKSVLGDFDITRAVSLLQSKRCDLLLLGYDDKVRNGIAHGQVIFAWPDIQYGDSYPPYKLAADEFLYFFDTLWRTANSLAIAILLFLARNQTSMPSAKNVLPTGIIYLIVATSMERTGLSIHGIIESEMRKGKQLHVLVETIFHKREVVILDCARTALRLLDVGAMGYTRYLFDIHQGTKTDSLLAILPEKLNSLQNEPYERIREILDAELIWSKESNFRNRLKALKAAFISNARLHWKKYIVEMQSKGLFLTTNKYYIKRITNSSAGGLARIHIFVTLHHSADADNRELVKSIIASVVRRFRRKWFATNPSKLLKHWIWFKRPTYIWVSLYKYEGPTRWVVYGGWLNKNLIVMAERVYSLKTQPIFVKKLDEMWMGIRLQYSIDLVAAANSIAGILKLAHQINQDSAVQKH